MKDETFELETDYTIEECKNILQKNMDTTFLIGERYLKFKGDSVKLFATRGNPYVKTFKGKFYRNGEKTLLTGIFHTSQISTVFIILSFLSYVAIFIVSVLVTKKINFSLLAIGLMWIMLAAYIIKKGLKIGEEDKCRIVKELETLLKADPNQKS